MFDMAFLLYKINDAQLHVSNLYNTVLAGNGGGSPEMMRFNV